MPRDWSKTRMDVWQIYGDGRWLTASAYTAASYARACLIRLATPCVHCGRVIDDVPGATGDDCGLCARPEIAVEKECAA